MLVRRELWAAALAVLIGYGALDGADAATVKASKIANNLAGRKTASGKRYNPHQMTAASKSLPLGSKVEVKNKKTGKKATVTVTDRGPYAKGRGLDLSAAAASKIGVKGTGSVDVKRKGQ